MATKNNRIIKAVLTTLAALGVAGGGTTGYLELRQFALTNAERIATNSANIENLESRHEREVKMYCEEVRALRALADTLVVKVSSTETQVNMLVQMVRDHMTTTPTSGRP